jgi:RNA polymerase sigma factor (sigma-70 family)
VSEARKKILDEQEVEVLLSSLQSHERLALKLKYWHDLTNREIAAVFGETVPVGTVGAWIARALQKLRVSLRRT